MLRGPAFSPGGAEADDATFPNLPRDCGRAFMMPGGASFFLISVSNVANGSYFSILIFRGEEGPFSK
jgi:hypothetical protein